MRREEIFHSDAGILGGTPVFTGTRVPVDTLTVHLKHGKRLDDFLDDFPSVNRAQAMAFLDLAEKELLGKIDAGVSDEERGRRMVEALTRLAERGAFADIEDPSEWQREVRRERSLPGRRGRD